jgi:hypothetical protein
MRSCTSSPVGNDYTGLTDSGQFLRGASIPGLDLAQSQLHQQLKLWAKTPGSLKFDSGVIYVGGCRRGKAMGHFSNLYAITESR